MEGKNACRDLAWRWVQENGKENYGEEPKFKFFETPIVVDNITGDITKERDLFVKKQFINVLKA